MDLPDLEYPKLSFPLFELIPATGRLAASIETSRPICIAGSIADLQRARRFLSQKFGRTAVS